MMNINDNQPEQGRSMVEMLGTLAIMGVLSAGAIGGYSYAMNKHRTNELIYEATKRAQWVGTQLDMHNSNPSLAGFGSGELGGGTITGSILTNLPNNQIGIVVSNLKEGVCEGVKNSISENTVIRAIKNADATGDVTCEDNGTAALIFNKDLGTTDSTGSGEDDESSCTDPCNECQKCDSGSCVEDSTKEGTSCNSGAGACHDGTCETTPTCELTASDCASGALAEGACACAPAEDESICYGWTTNECGTGKYCVFSPGSCTADPDPGVCKPVSYIGNYKTETVNGHEYTMSDYSNGPDWWTAQSWCQAFGKTMVTLSDLHCSSSGCTDTLWQDLGNALYQYTIWTQDLTDGPNSCYAFTVLLYDGNVYGDSRNDGGADVLCRD